MGSNHIALEDQIIWETRKDTKKFMALRSSGEMSEEDYSILLLAVLNFHLVPLVKALSYAKDKDLKFSSQITSAGINKWYSKDLSFFEDFTGIKTREGTFQPDVRRKRK